MKNIKNEIEQAVNLYKLQKFSEAKILTNKLITKNSKIPFLYNLLGLILTAQKRFDEAIDIYTKGLLIKEDYAMIYNNLGTIYKSKGNYLEAKKLYKKSISLDNKIAEPHNNLGNLYIDEGKYKDAVNCFKKSINNDLNFYAAHFNLGILYKNIGDFDNSKKYLRETIKINPRFCSAHRALSQINKYKINDKHISDMEEIYKIENISDNNKMELSFALGKAFDDVRKFNKAINFFNVGNQLRRKNVDFSITNIEEEFAKIKAIFNSSFLNKYKIKNSKIKPIFILGMPRSGTTLVEQIISNHPKVFGGGELIYFDKIIKKYLYNDNFLTNNIFDEIGHYYIEKIKLISGQKKLITDKLPINFKWIGFIKKIIPTSVIFHCTRNPKDTCLSIYKNFFTNTDLNYAYNINDLIKFYNLYRDLMNFWNHKFPNEIYEINYENLIKNPKNEIPSIIKNCNLKWNSNCIKFYENKRIVKTASDTQVRNKMYTKSINSWKNYDKFFSKYFDELKY